MRLPTAALLAILGLVSTPAAARSQPAGTTVPPLPDSSMQAASRGIMGSLAVRAVQGSKGGGDVGPAEVEIELLHRDQIIQRFKTKLDEHGVVVVGDLPVEMGVRALVRVKYANVLYQDVGPEMNAANPSASVEVAVFETTDQVPDWKVSMRHVRLSASAGAVSVSETVVVTNPSDRTWLGGPANAQGRRSVVSLTLPAGARDVSLESGFHGWCCTALSDRTITVQMPLMPGEATYRFSYKVDSPAGRAELLFAAPVRCEHLALFVSGGGATVEPRGVAPAALPPSSESPGMRMYQGDGLAAGTQVGMLLANVPGAPPPDKARQLGVPALLALALLTGAVGGGTLVALARARHRRRGGVSEPSHASLQRPQP